MEEPSARNPNRFTESGDPMALQVNRIYSDPFFARFRQHSCPKCGAQLELVKRSKTLDPSSKEAQAFGCELYPFGDAKFIWDEFECPQCGFQISIDDLRQMEKAARKRKG